MSRCWKGVSAMTDRNLQDKELVDKRGQVPAAAPTPEAAAPASTSATPEATQAAGAPATPEATQTAGAPATPAATQTAGVPATQPAHVENTFASGGLKDAGKKKRRPHGPSARFAQAEKPKDFKGAIANTLRYMSAYKWGLLGVIVFALASTVFNIVGPKVLSEATTLLFTGVVAKIAGTGGIDFDAVFRVLVTTIALYAVSAVCSFVQGWLMTGITQRVCFRLRNDIAAKINRMPFGYFERNATGDTLSRITNDVDTLGQSLNQGLTQLVTSTATVIGVLVMMLTINVPMTLVSLLVIPISALMVVFVVKRSQKYFTAQQYVLGEIDGMIEETFSGQTVVRAFGKERETVEAFDETNDRLYEAGWKSQFISGLMKPIMDFIGNLGYVAVAILGSVFAVQGIITVGDIQAFIQYVKNFTQPISQLTQISNVLQGMAAAAERIFSFLGEGEVEDAADTAPASDIDGSVVFDHVRFGYADDQPVIKDFCARVSPGQTVALVGPTGAGKTTMVKLLMRFYDPQGGRIMLGSHELSAYARRDVRNAFGMVLQDTWLFSGSIRENIRYGNLNASDADVEAAARAAFAHHFIMTLPGGYDFVINEDASNISAGQRQLLTIARSILADRRMLILDEATSSVDTRTEERIQDAMDNLMRGRTSFVIAHRLSTIRNADLILVIRDGDIVEQGTHEELLALCGFYAELYNSQFKDCAD